ncbi:unnamed protein product [Pylaiella littoralis]
MNFRAQRHRQDIRCVLLMNEPPQTKNSTSTSCTMISGKPSREDMRGCRNIQGRHNHFSMCAHDIFENRDSTHLKSRRAYEQARNKGLDDIAVMITDRVKRLRSWSTRKIKLVQIIIP